MAIINEGEIIDTFDLKDNPENQENLEIRFFKITGTYEKRLFEDYAAQEMSDARPDNSTQDYHIESAVKPKDDADNKEVEKKKNKKEKAE